MPVQAMAHFAINRLTVLLWRSPRVTQGRPGAGRGTANGCAHDITDVDDHCDHLYDEDRMRGRKMTTMPALIRGHGGDDDNGDNDRACNTGPRA